MRRVLQATAAVVVLAGIAWVAWQLSHRSPEIVDSGPDAGHAPGTEPREPGKGERGDRHQASTLDAAARRDPADAATLSLRLTVDGAPIESGHVFCQSSTDPLELGTWTLLPRTDGSLHANVQRAGITAGVAELRVPFGHWTWAQVRTDDGGLQRFVLLEPALRPGERTIAFERGKPRIHVFVLDEDLGGVASCGVDLHLRDMVLGGPAQRVSSKPADAVGHACFDVAGPGLYLATPEGVPAEASAPHRAMVLRHPTARDHDHVLKVATQRKAAKLTLVLTSGNPPAVRDPIVLYLENLGSGPRWFPLHYKPRQGRVEVACTLPAGRYRLDALPDGVLVPGSAGAIDVFPERSPPVEIGLAWNEATCRLTLEGVHRDAFPVTVSRRVAERSAVTRTGGAYLGAYRWAAAVATVSAVGSASWLNVVGRRRSYLSAAKVDLAGNTQTAPLVPATLVTVRVLADSSAPGVDGWTLLVESSLGHESAALGTELLQEGFGAQILRSALLLLPRGTARIVLWDAVAQRIVAERTVSCQEDEAELHLSVPAR